jgi:hypothetical protein
VPGLQPWLSIKPVRLLPVRVHALISKEILLFADSARIRGSNPAKRGLWTKFHVT